jgi:hypothetical protein
MLHEEAMPEAIDSFERFAMAREILFGDKDRHCRSP